jgi:hypothetical protein
MKLKPYILFFICFVITISIYAQSNRNNKDSIVNKNEIILKYSVTFPVNPKDYPDIKKLVINGCLFRKEIVLEFKKLEILEVNLYDIEVVPHNCPQKLIDLEDIIRELKHLKHLKICGGYYVKVPENIVELKQLKSIWLESDLYPVSILQLKKLVVVEDGGVSEAERGNLSSFYYSSGFDSFEQLPRKYKYRRKINIPKNGTFVNYYDSTINSYKAGHKMVEGNFVNGKPDGKWTYWFYEGTVAQVRYYNNGVETGDWIVWDRDRSVIAEYKFDNGKLVSYKKYKKD